jgi:tetratricopeptide (TPR) repeat protein
LLSVEIQYSHFDRIVQLLDWNRYKEAIKEGENYIRTYPDDPEGFAILGKIYVQVDKFNQAIRLVQEALQKDPENPLAWEVSAEAYYTKKDWKSAKKVIQEALVLFPENSFYHFLEGNIYNRSGNFKQAKLCFEKAIELYPDNAIYLANYSYVLSLLGYDVGSHEIEKQALRLAPEDSMVFLYLGWAAEHRGDLKKALQFFEEAVRINPESPQMRKEYLEVLQKQYTLYRILLLPSKLFTKFKPGIALLIWIGACLIFKPLLFVFIALYVVTHWMTRLIVNIKVFGSLRGR